MTTNPQPLLITQTQAAKLLGVSRSTVCRWLKESKVGLRQRGKYIEFASLPLGVMTAVQSTPTTTP